jgi:hypothetical protein
VKAGDLVQISSEWNGYDGLVGIIQRIVRDCWDKGHTNIRLADGRIVYVFEEYIEVISEGR